MEKKTIKNSSINESYICLKHKTGLKILLYPMQGYSSACAMFGTKYGSVDRVFKTNLDSDFLTVPDGIAHYLEHKLFESEEGNVFDLFAKTGASANAYTSFDRTAYYFSCTDNFNESLKVLMNFVQDPYFTEESVQKEQGIIGQEIRMYDDNPGWRVLFNCLDGMYHNHPVKVDIAGTVETISKIDKDLLYRCYNTFYNLNNMALVITGSFDAHEAISIIEENIKDKEALEIERGAVQEPKTVVRNKTEIKLSVSQPQFCIGFKMDPPKESEKLKKEVAFNILCEILLGESSPLYREFYETGLVAGGNVGAEVFSGNGYFSVLFDGETKDPDKVYEKICDYIKKLKKDGSSEQEFLRVKKALYGKKAQSYGSVNEAANVLLQSALLGNGFFDELDTIANIDYQTVMSYADCFKKENSSISIVSSSEE